MECIYEGNILEDKIYPTEDLCKSICSVNPKSNYYVYDKENGTCLCLDSKSTLECAIITGPQKPSLSTDCNLNY